MDTTFKDRLKAIEEEKQALIQGVENEIEERITLLKSVGRDYLLTKFKAEQFDKMVHKKYKRFKAHGGGPRGPRSFKAIVMTSATRNLNELHKTGANKAVALRRVNDRINAMAADKSKKITPEIEAAVAARAAEIWGVTTNQK